MPPRRRFKSRKLNIKKSILQPTKKINKPISKTIGFLRGFTNNFPVIRHLRKIPPGKHTIIPRGAIKGRGGYWRPNRRSGCSCG